jgi:ring-1,2-phenylacetyl-CoA epoxidase subunit PaaC
MVTSEARIQNSKVDYTLHLADNALILGHRNSEWCGHGPVLEHDIAITNISLDLIGQARNFYQYASELINKENGNSTTEDTLAYLRDNRDFKNCLLAEQLNGDWAVTILRQFFFSVYQYLVYQKLQASNDKQLGAIAEKALKEVAYHVGWSSEWVIRLGDGTEESNKRMLKAIDDLWTFSGELFQPASYEKKASESGFGVDVTALYDEWIQKIKSTFKEATLPIPDKNSWMQYGGKEGIHTEHLGYILANMQFLQRAYPNCEW